MGNKQHAANKEEVLLRARLNALKSEIAQYEDIMEDVKRWRSDKTQMESELETLRQKVDQYGDAADIVAKKKLSCPKPPKEKPRPMKKNLNLKKRLLQSKLNLNRSKRFLATINQQKK